MDIKEVLDKFSDVRIAVVGDVMLDTYVYGSVNRISIEAPVPIIHVEGKTYELGGAGNVAANIASLGGKIFLFGYTGQDSAREILLKKLNENNINHELFPVLQKTIQKTRIMGNNQQIVRIDEEFYESGRENIERELASAVSSVDADIIIASDYAKGCLSGNLFSKIKSYNSGKKIIVDPKPQNQDNYFGVYLIKPNLKEAKEMTGLDDVEEIGKKLQEEFDTKILLTRGRNGMSLFYENKVINIPTQAKEVYDVTGAGDSVMATLGLCLASGVSLEDSAFLANHVAGIAVGKVGTSSVSRNELIEVVNSENRKIKNLEELIGIKEDYKRKGRSVVWTNGCFDLLHAGHVNYLKKAKEQGDCLIVGLNTDDSVRKLKGDGRPINTEQLRAEVLASLECVDYVLIFDELSVENYLNRLKPDIYVKGGDYDKEKIHQGERRIIENYGGKIKFISFENKISTSQIIDRIRNGRA